MTTAPWKIGENCYASLRDALVAQQAIEEGQLFELYRECHEADFATIGALHERIWRQRERIVRLARQVIDHDMDALHQQAVAASSHDNLSSYANDSESCMDGAPGEE